MSNGTTSWNYSYDSNGMRTSRSNDSKTYSYVYNGSQLMQMTCGSDTLNFTYDANGLPLTVTYNGTTYYYVTNLQGDVACIIGKNGANEVVYEYDAWGTVLSIEGFLADTLGQINPLRYRGYVYDTETQLYYLQSRYYNPQLGRFINADALVSTGQGLLGNNMFSYCLNSPMSYSDHTGNAARNSNIVSICDGGGGRSMLSVSTSTKPYEAIQFMVDVGRDLERVDYNPFNDDEGAVLESKYISFYKGQLVFRADIDNNRSGSYIVMVLDRDSADRTTVQHEYGHFRQLKMMGLVDFTATVPLPSVILGAIMGQRAYSIPCERSADMLGGVDRGGYIEGSDFWAILFLVYGLLLP